MTRRIFHFGLLALVLVAGTGAYALRQGLGPPAPRPADCTRHWLSLSQSQCEQIQQDDPDFHTDAQALSQSLRAHQQALIADVSEPATPAEQIRAQAEAVVEAHQALMRRIVQHLLAVRRHADVRQCTLLNQLYANVVQTTGLQNGAGPGRQRRGYGGPPWAPGQGTDQGQGRGMGRGQRHRYGQLASSLGLTAAQQAAATQTDPNYTADAARLTQEVRDAYAAFVRALQDLDTPDAQVQQALEAFITSRRQLELRTVDYVLSIRPLLSAEQQQQLIGLSRRGGGRRWRGGRL